jgi:hypothetical protein
MKQKKIERIIVGVDVVITYSNGEKETKIISGATWVDDIFNTPTSTPKRKIPNYSFFCEVEDGLMYIKGVNKEMMVGTVDAARWPKAEKQYAMYLLKNDNDLTEDDKSVLNKIIQGII